MTTIPRYYGLRCESCHEPMQRDQDRVHVFRFGHAVWLHWPCMVRQLLEINQRAAEAEPRILH